MSTCTRVRYAVASLAVVALAGGLTACGDDAPAGPSAVVETASNGDVFNDADVRFATAMVPHHAQAIEMVSLADGRPLDPAVREVADEIREARAPEVESMVDWLTAWDREVPETSLDHANAGHDPGEGGGDQGADHGDDGPGDLPGLLSEGEMDALAAAPDPEFQDLWLELMVEHHAGAVELAAAEQEDGEFADAIALAETIEAGQRAQIDRLEELLG